MALPRRHFHRVTLHPPGEPTALRRSLSKDGVAKEDHPNIQPYGQAGNRIRGLQVSSLRLSTELTSTNFIYTFIV